MQEHGAVGRLRGEDPAHQLRGERQQQQFGTIPIPNIFGTIPIPNIFGTIPIPNIFGTIPIPNIFGTIPIPNIFGIIPIPNIFARKISGALPEVYILHLTRGVVGRLSSSLWGGKMSVEQEGKRKKRVAKEKAQRK